MNRTHSNKLHDCRLHGVESGAELFVVEGDSASKSVCRVRDKQYQAVIPMQGKPMNAMKSSKQAVQRYTLFASLVDAIGAGWDDDLDLSRMRFSRIILLFDPDADGIHCGALVSLFFYRWMRPVIESGRLFTIRPPLFEILSPKTGETIYAYGESQYKQICEELQRLQITFESRRYRGLASMNEKALISTCIDPATRNLQTLSTLDAETAIRVFMATPKNH